MKTKLIVLHSYPIWLPQTQTWMHTQVSELQRRGVDAHVVCERTENLEQFAVRNIHSLSDRPMALQLWDRGVRKLGIRHHLAYLARVGRSLNASIVHSHFGHVGWGDLGAVRTIGARHVVTFYGLDVNKLPQQARWRKRYGDLFASADRFLCEGPHMKECLVALGCEPNKIEVQHLGVSVDQIPFEPRHWLPGETLRILIAASFREKKGIPGAIEAVSRISKDVPVELTIIGDAGADESSKAEKRRILEAIERGGLKGRCKLMGYQTHAVMMREALDSHVFVQASMTASDGDTEGGAPVSITEVMATGMPVVSTFHCDIPSVVGDAYRKYLAPERDSAGLSEKLAQLLEDAKTWERLATVGRMHVEAEYDRVKQSAKLARIYSRLQTLD